MARKPVESSSAAADVLLGSPPSRRGSSMPPSQATVAPAQLTQSDLERVANLAWRVFRRLGVGEHQVADAVQDALIVVHRRLPEFRGESKFETWAYGILLRVASDYRRRSRRASRVFAPVQVFVEPNLRCDAPNPCEHLEQQEAADFIRRLLDRLPEEARVVFVLVELEELTLPAAAEALGLSESTVKSRLRSARKQFDAALKRELARRSAE